MPGAPSPTPRRSARPSPFVASLVVLCLALAAVDLLLIRRNRELSARVDELSRRVRAAERSPVPALEGRHFPADELLDAAGEPTFLAALPPGHATLLLVSSDACDLCARALPRWEDAARRAAGTHVRVLGLVLDATPAGLAGRAAPWPLLAPIDPTLAARVPGVPAALLLDADGVVRRAAYGAEQVELDALLDDALAEPLAGDGG